MALNYEFVSDIEATIRSVENEYRRNQGLILTESDLAALIYTRLRSLFSEPFNRSGLHWHMHTQDTNVIASPLHLEVPWYDVNGKLKIRPDITILEPTQLSILHRYGDGLRLPSKQFEFAGNAIILELKFIRHKSGITVHALEKIRRDFDKIKTNIQNHIGNIGIRRSFYCLFVVFNKTDNRCSEFDQYLAEHAGGDWYKYIYGSGQVTF
ncbi:hypothetical protein ACFLWI_01385 [Chloroflexota bacterium]